MLYPLMREKYCNNSFRLKRLSTNAAMNAQTSGRTKQRGRKMVKFAEDCSAQPWISKAVLNPFLNPL